ncbi:hypothetical protein COCNU_08G001910, partial [Cocos nucifera]
GEEERVYFDGGAHYGDLVANLLLGCTLLWLPLTLATVFRAFFLRYCFINWRVTIISVLTARTTVTSPMPPSRTSRSSSGSSGDKVITLKDGIKMNLGGVPNR